MNFGKKPKRATVKSAGYDLYAPEVITFRPNQWVHVVLDLCLDGTEKMYTPRTGFLAKLKTKMFGMERVENYMMVLAPKSGLGREYKMRFANTIGIVDQDYPMNIELDITVDTEYTCMKGEKIAQALFVPYLVWGDEDVPTEVRKGGHGSTGKL